MKKILITFAVTFFSLTGFARQYTQCTDMEKQLFGVVNLPSKEAGTLFLTLGAEYDVHQLYKIAYRETKNDKAIYTFKDGTNYEGLLIVPANLIGLTSNNVYIEIEESGLLHQFSCFTRVYED